MRRHILARLWAIKDGLTVVMQGDRGHSHRNIKKGSGKSHSLMEVAPTRRAPGTSASLCTCPKGVNFILQ